jgi:hypothetical protein
LDQEKHANILLIFIHVNYTIELQPINVILQKPLKQAFKVHFNSWNFQTIKDRIDDGHEPMVYFKMGNMKSKIFSIEMKAMKSIIIEEWDKISISRSFLPTFQPITMEANTPMPLFK